MMVSIICLESIYDYPKYVEIFTFPILLEITNFAVKIINLIRLLFLDSVLSVKKKKGY